jgi:hypothetical protein
MGDKKKILITNTKHGTNYSFPVPEGSSVTHVGDWVVVYEGSWRTDVPIFKYQLQSSEAYFLVNLSEDEALIEAIKLLKEADMTTLRNIMEASELL